MPRHARVLRLSAPQPGRRGMGARRCAEAHSLEHTALPLRRGTDRGTAPRGRRRRRTRAHDARARRERPVESVGARSAAHGPPRSRRVRRPLLPPGARGADRRLGRRDADARAPQGAARSEPEFPRWLATRARAGRRRPVPDLGARGAHRGGVRRLAPQHHRRDPVPHLQRRPAAPVLAPRRRHHAGRGSLDLSETWRERERSSPAIRTSPSSTTFGTTPRT